MKKSRRSAIYICIGSKKHLETLAACGRTKKTVNWTINKIAEAKRPNAARFSKTLSRIVNKTNTRIRAMNKSPFYIDIERFLEDSDKFFNRARNGENIVIKTAAGKPAFSLLDNKYLGEFPYLPPPVPKVSVSKTTYLELIDLLDPLDE